MTEEGYPRPSRRDGARTSRTEEQNGEFILYLSYAEKFPKDVRARLLSCSRVVLLPAPQNWGWAWSWGQAAAWLALIQH